MTRPAAYKHTLFMEGGQTATRITATQDSPFTSHSPEYVVLSEPLVYQDDAKERTWMRRWARREVARRMKAVGL